MPWTPWIQIEPDENSDIKKSDISDLTRITSLTPEVSKRIDQLCAAVYQTKSSLSIKEKEIIALVTSSLIGCVH